MSHELRTPLNAIIGFSEMLTNETQMRLDAERRHEYADLINDSGHHLLSVVNGILDMTKIETGDFEIRPEPFRLAGVIGDCCDLLALKAREAGIDLVVDVPADLPEIVADKRALKQILINLLSNAIKFTDRGGRIAVSAAAEGAMIAITVEDNGIGIGEEDLPRVGNPFFQARGSYDRRHDGTGLGLSIVKGLVALHGGDIAIRSRVGEGTRVTVRLPLDCEKARPRPSKTSHELEPRRAGREPLPAGARDHDGGEEKCVTRPSAIDGMRTTTTRNRSAGRPRPWWWRMLLRRPRDTFAFLVAAGAAARSSSTASISSTARIRRRSSPSSRCRSPPSGRRHTSRPCRAHVRSEPEAHETRFGLASAAYRRHRQCRATAGDAPCAGPRKDPIAELLAENRRCRAAHAAPAQQPQAAAAPIQAPSRSLGAAVAPGAGGAARAQRFRLRPAQADRHL